MHSTYVFTSSSITYDQAILPISFENGEERQKYLPKYPVVLSRLPPATSNNPDGSRSSISSLNASFSDEQTSPNSEVSSTDLKIAGYVNSWSDQDEAVDTQSSKQFVNFEGSQIIKINSRIGSGMFGIVYKGLILTEDDKFKPAALKHMKQGNGSLEKLNQVELERTSILYQFMQSEKIPGVIPIHGIMLYKEHLFVGMKFCNSGDLLKFIENRTLMPLEKLNIAIGVGVTVTNLHRAGFVHHDIKLDNIMVNERKKEDGTFIFYLADVGFVEHTSQSRPIPSFFNWHYAPSKALKAAESTDTEFRSSIWNDPKYDDCMFGVMLWQLFTENYTSLPWSVPENPNLSKDRHLFIGEKSLVSGFSYPDQPIKTDWHLPETIESEVKNIVDRLVSWDTDHLSTEEAIQQLAQLLE